MSKSDVPTRAPADGVTAPEKRRRAPPIEILYADDMFLAEGIPLDLYPDSIQQTESTGKSYVLTVESQRSGIVRKPFLKDSVGQSIELDPARVGPPLLNLIVRRYRDTTSTRRANYRYARSVHGHTAAAPYSGSMRVAMVGDSIWANDVVNYTKLELQNLGYTVQMIGTMNNVGSLGEARVQAKASDITYATTAKAPIVSVPDYNARDSVQANPSGKWAYNPFIRPAVDGDPPGFVKNGYIFDYADYLTKFSLASPDFIAVNLGTNDIWGLPSPDSLNSIADALDIIYQQCRTAAPNAQIGLFFPRPAETGTSNPVWDDEYKDAIRALMVYVRDKRAGGDTRLWCVALWAHMSPNGGFVVEGSSNVTVSVDPDSQMKTIELNDYLHPFTAGRRQIAEVVTSWVACCQQGV